jgi:predicted MPP superfamily phosphohydrolase
MFSDPSNLDQSRITFLHITATSTMQTTSTTRRMIIPSKTVLAFLASVVIVMRLAVRNWTSSSLKPELSFSKAGSFKILQLTDLHYGEEPSTDWGPIQDRNTSALIRLVLMREQPDLVVLTGDQLTADNVDENATVYYNQLANLLDEYHVPYALIFGNHDDNTFWKKLENGTDIRHAAKTDRLTLMRSHQRHLHSLSQVGPFNVSGVSNYVLNVYKDSRSVSDDDDDDAIALQIIMLDSGGGSMTEEIVDNQLTWYLSQRRPGVAAVAFQHIPTAQFVFNDSTETTCGGFNGEDGIAPLENDPASEISFLHQNDPDLHFLAVGHNHGNSYCCRTDNGGNESGASGSTSNLHLCFGRHSGYGGYGSWYRGARVYEITLVPSASYVHWRSWVRLDSGEIVDEFEPSASR